MCVCACVTIMMTRDHKVEQLSVRHVVVVVVVVVAVVKGLLGSSLCVVVCCVLRRLAIAINRPIALRHQSYHRLGTQNYYNLIFKTIYSRVFLFFLVFSSLFLPLSGFAVFYFRMAFTFVCGFWFLSTYLS